MLREQAQNKKKSGPNFAFEMLFILCFRFLKDKFSPYIKRSKVTLSVL